MKHKPVNQALAERLLAARREKIADACRKLSAAEAALTEARDAAWKAQNEIYWTSRKIAQMFPPPDSGVASLNLGDVLLEVAGPADWPDVRLVVKKP